MASKEESLSEVHIGDVTGGIYGSIIAGRDVTNATITIGGQPTPADKEPTVSCIGCCWTISRRWIRASKAHCIYCSSEKGGVL